MTYNDKVINLKNELTEFLNEKSESVVNNSIYRTDPNLKNVKY